MASRSASAVITILVFFVAVFLPVPGFAFEVGISPQPLRPGDPFLLKVALEPQASEPDPPAARIKGNGGSIPLWSCGAGCFMGLGAVDLSAPTGRIEIEVSAGRLIRTAVAEVIDGDFSVQRITLPDDKVNLSAEDEARAEREQARLEALLGEITQKRWSGPFIMPLANSFSTEFGARRIINETKSSSHRGIDIRGAAGEPVKAANRGVIVLVDDTFFGGNTVVADHGMGVFTIYMHLSKVNVMEREMVSKGDIIGLVGSTGRSTGPHLHYGVKVGGVSANPEALNRLPL